MSIDLRGCPSDVAYERVLEALAASRVSIADAQKLAGIVKLGVEIRDVAEFRRRLEAAESAHRATLEATRETARRLQPARRQTVEVFAPAEPEASPVPFPPASGAMP